MTLINDIALIRLSKRLELNVAIQLTCLPKEKMADEPRIDRLAWAVGFGSFLNAIRNRNALFNGEMNVYNTSMCSHLRPEIPKEWSSQFCAGGYDADLSHHACHSDYNQNQSYKDN
jgi:hypothetical protein